MSVKTFAKKMVEGTKKHAPLILAITGLVAAGATVVLAVRETPKVKTAMEEKKTEKVEELRKALPDDKQDCNIKAELTIVEKSKIVVKHCWPAMLTSISCIAAIAGSQIISGKRLSAAEFARDAAEKAFNEYVESTVKKVGAKKEDEIRQDVAQRAVEKNPPNKELIVSGSGDVLCLDMVTNQWFNSTVNAIKKAQNDINAMCLSGEFVTINDFYDALDVRHVPYGDNLGWMINPGDANTELLNIEYLPNLNDSDELILCINYTCRDKYNSERITGDDLYL